MRHAQLESLEERRLLSHAIPGKSLAAETASVAAPNPVVAWNAVALEAIRESKTSPPVASRDLAILQVSVYDAVNSIAPTGRAHGVRVKAPAGTSLAAAVSGAADEALSALFPNQTALFNTALSQSLSTLPSSRGTVSGLALGKTVADQELALRANDGSKVAASYTPSTQAGLWQPTPPANAPALLPGWGNVTPFVLTSESQFRPAGPPAITSAAYAAALNQVESLGAKNSTTRTADQTQIALFWADGGGTETPPGHWNAIAEQVATSRHDSIVKDARVFAMLDTALADAAIACWNTKFTANLWRPITAIRLADTDNNPATTADPSWTPLLATPPFPSYVSGHSTFSAAAATILSAVYGPNTHFNATSDGLPGVTRSFKSFNDAANEAGMSRIYGGIHFSFDNRDGLALGRSIGDYVVKHAFRVR